MEKVRCKTTLACTSVLLAGLTALVWVGAPWTSERIRDTARRPARGDGRQAHLTENYGRVPLHFEANRGQTDERVKFLTRGRGYTMFLTANEAVLALSDAHAREHKDRHLRRREPEAQRQVKRSVLRMTFPGANATARVEGRDELRGKANYFIGNDPEKWRTNVSTYARVQYSDLYPGIDLVYYGNQRALEYDFVVAPGADPTRIALGFEGADRMEIEGSGDLVLHTRHGALRQRKPFIYQEVDGVRREIAGGYVARDDDSIGFRVAAYDATRPLVIDPALFYSTYLGGGGVDQGVSIAVDDAGSAYVTGGTDLSDFPTTPGAFDVSFDGPQDVFVTKLDATGSELVYSTYLGGVSGEFGYDIVVDMAGSAYVCGETGSSDFPTTLVALDTSLDGGADGFVTKLSATGAALTYSTYLGGSDGDTCQGIAIDADGNAYVTGSTLSIDFPTTLLVFQPTFGGGDPETRDAFVTKLNPMGSGLVYSSYLGGNAGDSANKIALDAAGNAYVTGFTSVNFPTTLLAFDTTANGADEGFVTKVNSTGSALVYSTYLGGSGTDQATSIAVDAMGSAYVTGVTDSNPFPTTTGAYQETYNGGDPDAFVTKLNPAGTGLVYSTYLGGTVRDQGRGIAVDTMGNAHVSGVTDSTDFPITPGGFQETLGGGLDAFVAKLNSAGSDLVYSTYLGGSSDEFPSDTLALDAFLVPNAYLSGTTDSTDFPTTNGAFDTTYAGNTDAFVAQIADVELPATPTTGRVQGAGRIAEGKFHLLAQAHNDGTFSGKVQYTSDTTNARVKSEMITLLLIDGNMARIDGTCTVDGTPCTFRVDVTDDPDTTDTFEIQVLGGPNEGGPVTKGNIRIEP